MDFSEVMWPVPHPLMMKGNTIQKIKMPGYTYFRHLLLGETGVLSRV